jgi:hypothetical protein
MSHLIHIKSMMQAPRPLAVDMSLVDKSKLNMTAGHPVKMPDAPGLGGSWVYYSQCDSRWAYQELGSCSQYTICSAGCAMSSVAMMLATKGVSVDPSSLDIWLTNNGGYVYGCDIIWAMVDAFGATSFQGIEVADESAICNGLASMHGIIANVNGGSHWVLLTGCAGNGVFYVNDPGYSRSTYSMSEILQEAVYH